MGINDVKKGKLLYHLTELNNLDSILEYGLLSRKLMEEKKLIFTDVADQTIMSKRVALGLDSYIPFHFHPYSSFDVAVKSRNHEKEFVYICITRELAIHNKFQILPKHPLSHADCNLMNYCEGFSKIDWDAMHTYGNEDAHIKHVKMAECLTHLIIPGKHFHCIAVRNEEVKRLVEEKLQKNSILVQPPFVNIQKWF